MTKYLTGEAAIKHDVLELLKRYGVRHWRMNAGSAIRRMKGHKPGTPDILAAPAVQQKPIFLWIETKDPKGKTNRQQREAQEEFAASAIANGEIYLKAFSAEDVAAKLRELRGSTEDHPVPIPEFPWIDPPF